MLKDFEIKKWNKRKIVIYGTGEDGKTIANELLKHSIEDFVFCDTYKKNKNILNRPIFTLDIVEEEKNANFILGSSKYCLEIYKKLKELGVMDNNIYTAKKICALNVCKFRSHDLKEVSGNYRYENSFLEMESYLDNGWFLKHLDVTVTEICTLRCKACCSLIPLYKAPRNCDRDILFEAFDNLLHSKCYIATVNLMGGEPLVNQELIQEILLKYKDEKQIGTFQIISNGTIVPNEKTLNAMKKNGRFFMIFSNYGELSKEQKKAVKCLEEYGIESAIVEEKDINAEGNTLWIDYGEVRHYNFSKEKNQNMFENCMDSKYCTTLLNGKLFICTRIAHGVNLGLIPEQTSRCSINLLNESLKGMKWIDVKKKCVDFLNNGEYPPACEYCNRDAGILTERAKQIE